MHRFRSNDIKTTVYNYKRYKYHNLSDTNEYYTYDPTYPNSMGYPGEWEYQEAYAEFVQIAIVDGDVKLYGGYGADSWYAADVNSYGNVSEYITYDTLENSSGELRNISGAINSPGKLATLLIFRQTNQDPTASQLQYVDQILLGSNGEYNFDFRTKDEPDRETGDFIILLAVEGGTTPIYIDRIEAPKPLCIVTFTDDDGIVLSQQSVVAGTSAVLPPDPEKDGYDFVGWNDTTTNILHDTTIAAIFRPKKLTVIFVDTDLGDLDIREFEYGDSLYLETLPERIGNTFDEWVDENGVAVTLVTQNMTVIAKYTLNSYTITFIDWGGNTLSEQIVEYGGEAVPPNAPYSAGLIFAGWSDDSSIYFVHQDATIHPIFEFTQTVETPNASITLGNEPSTKLVSLSCQTAGAQIYYYFFTVDESEDYNWFVEFEWIEYTTPIVMSESGYLMFFAALDGMNDSYIELYANEISDDDPDPSATIVSVSQATGRPGQTVEVLVTAYNSPLLAGLEFKLHYDEAALTLTAATLPDGSGFDFLLPPPYPSGTLFMFIPNGTQAVDANGTLINLTYKIDEDADPDLYNITISDFYAEDENKNEIAYELVPGRISVNNIQFGYFTGGTRITGTDVLWISRYLASGRSLSAMKTNFPTTIESFFEDAARFTNGTRVTGTDVLWISRYLASGRDAEAMVQNFPTTIDFSHLGVVSPLAQPAFASILMPFDGDSENIATLTASRTDVAVGDTFTVTVGLDLEVGENVSAFEFYLKYDPAVLRLLDTYDFPGELETLLTPKDPGNANFILFTKLSSTTPQTGRQDIMILTFEVLDDSTTASIEMEIDFVENENLKELTMLDPPPIVINAPRTFIIDWDATPVSFATLDYGYAAGSTASFTIKNDGNQSVTDISAAITAGSTSFEVTTEPLESLAPGATATIAVRSLTGLDAGIHTGELTLTWTGGSGATGITQSLSQTVNKIDYTGTKTASDNVIAEQATIGKTLTLPTLPADATYAAVGTAGGSTPALISGTPSVTAGVLAYDVTSESAGASATITIHVNGGTNYNDFDVVVTITAQTLGAGISGDIIGFTGIPLSGTQQITVTLIGDEFAATLSGDWITNLPSGLNQSATRVDATTALITVTGTPSTASNAQIAVTIPASSLTVNSGIALSAANSGNSVYGIAESTYSIDWDGASGNFAALDYGYAAGSTVTYTIKNDGNQTVTGIFAAITTGSTSFEVSSAPLTSLPPGATATITVRTLIGHGAGSHTGELLLTWSGGSGTAGITQSLSQTINKINYTGSMTASDSVIAGQATIGKTLILPVLPSGASYAAVGTVGGNTPTLISGTPSVAGGVLSYDVTNEAAGSSATITILVNGGANYNDFDVVATITAQTLSADISGSISGFTGIPLAGTQEINVNLVGDAFAATLSGNWITNLPSGLSQTVSRLDSTTAKITVAGTASAASSGQLTVSIPAGSLLANSGTALSASNSGNSLYNIIASTYSLDWDGVPGSFAALNYGYAAGSTVTFTIQNVGNQTVTGISAAITVGSSNFEVIAEPASSLAPGTTATIAVRTLPGLDAGIHTGELMITWTGGSGSSGISQNLSQLVNKVDYTGAKAISYDVESDTAATGISLSLPTPPMGASYSFATMTSLTFVENPSVTGATLSFDVTAQADGTETDVVLSVIGAVNYNPYDFVVTVMAKDVVQEATPAVSIDFIDELLVGFVPDDEYTVNGLSVVAGSNGSISIDALWFGQNLSIVKVGVTSAGTVDSDAQIIQIPQRPIAPTPTAANTTGGGSNGSITDIDSTMEYKLIAAVAWSDVSGTTVTGLAAGTYTVRIKATANSFASLPSSVVIASSSSGGRSSGRPSTPIIAPEEEAKSTELPSGNIVDTPAGQDPVQNNDGSVTLPGGGTITIPGDIIVEAPPGTSIQNDGTIQLPPNSGGTITLPGSDSSGESSTTVAVPPGSTINADGTVTTPSQTTIVDRESPLAENPFGDISMSNWHYDAVMFVYTRNLMNGTSTSPMLFSPNTQISRSMVVTVLYRYAGSPDISSLETPFNDVREGMYYTDAVKWAAANSIVSGYGDGRFGPDDNVTREQLAVMLNNFANHIKLSLTKVNSYTGFPDSASISNYATHAVERLFEAGIIGGYPDSTFKPQGNTTRAEFAVMLMRFFESASSL